MRESQRGSHVKLARKGPGGERQVLTVPMHRELDTAITTEKMRWVAAFCRCSSSGTSSW